MSRWEYKVFRHKVLLGKGESDLTEDPESDAILNRQGAEGWELAAVVQQSYRREYDPTSLYGYTFFIYYLKRQTG